MTDQNTKADNFYNALLSLCESSERDLEIQQNTDEQTNARNIIIQERQSRECYLMLQISDGKIRIAYDTVNICSDIPESGEKSPLAIEIAYSLRTTLEEVLDAIDNAQEEKTSPSHNAEEPQSLDL